MLVIGDLSTAIKNKVNGLTNIQRVNSLAVHSAYADAIVEYLSENIEIQGAYSGTISGSSDPLNGDYTWSINDMELTGQAIMAGAQGSWIGWRNAVRDGIRSIETIGSCNEVTEIGGESVPTVTTSVAAYLSLYILNYIQTDMNKTASFDDATDKLAEKIINSFAGVLPDPLSVTASSAVGGIGAVVFYNIK